MIQAYILYFDPAITKIQTEVIQLNTQSNLVSDDELNNYLCASGYEFVDYSEDIAIIVDENGFSKSANPVFEVETLFGDTVKLAGRLIFVRNIYNEFSTDIGSVKKEDIFNLRMNLEIKLIGLLNTDLDR